VDIKIFTLREANKRIPKIERDIKTFMSMSENATKYQDRLGVLELIGGTQEGTPHHEEFKEAQGRLSRMVDDFNRLLKEIHDVGCLVKDLHRGLVDFYSKHDGRLIFLCWKLGEERIEYWHELDDGFVGRRHISELMKKS